MLKLFLCTAIALATVQASGEFVVLHSPDSVQFHGNDEVEQSLLKEVWTAALGFTIKKGTWPGISITNPFNLPEAVVVIVVEGVDSLELPEQETFPLNVNEIEETTWQALSGRLEESGNNNTLIRISLGDGLNALGQSSLGELKPTPIDQTSLKALSLIEEEDREFLEEMQLLHAIAEKVPSVIKVDSKSDVYWLVVSGLRPIFDIHGKNSSAAKEAMVLLHNAFDVIREAFIQAYDGKVLISAFTNDASQVRHTRATILERKTRDNKQNDGQDENKNVEDEEDKNKNIDSTSESNSDISTSTENNDFRGDTEGTEISDQELTSTESNINYIAQKIEQDDLNLSKDYSEDYPVIFNILLWFGVIFVFSLLAICIAIADMDPGRDSIIYRMTSNRMKKDN